MFRFVLDRIQSDSFLELGILRISKLKKWKVQRKELAANANDSFLILRFLKRSTGDEIILRDKKKLLFRKAVVRNLRTSLYGFLGIIRTLPYDRERR
ncbi:hypothetical protein LEP1GSC052_1458 [Leptospira kmetyi serovar Malaysia str. Bejo-Iso9]|nr:hypothetical protein LEP1GSC052_1458 [Leptospira kmetyi serovar Malaysia str. Bejo-Iso9]